MGALVGGHGSKIKKKFSQKSFQTSGKHVLENLFLFIYKRYEYTS
jgi:hypothetical protein